MLAVLTQNRSHEVVQQKSSMMHTMLTQASQEGSRATPSVHGE